MRAQAQQAEGKWMNYQQSQQLASLQRQVAHRLVQAFRADRGPSTERYDTYAAHLVALQRHALSKPVVRVALGLIPVGEQPSLQRAMDVALQREQEQQAQDVWALQDHAVQRQLEQLEAAAAQPVLQRIQARRGAGNPLPEAVQRHLAQELNYDLSAVRIHADSEADILAKSVHAVAFTTGSDIFFRAGTYNPNTPGGLELLAHEVTHTVQQRQGRVGPGVDPDAGLEAEARRMGAKLARVMPSVHTLLPSNPHAPGVYSPKAALARVQDGAAQRVALKPLHDLQPSGHTVQRFGNPLSWAADKAKEGVASALSAIPGYRELSLALGRDLVTGKAMNGNPDVILDALALWVPGPLKDVLRALKETGAIPKAWAWFGAELGRLNLGGAWSEVTAAIGRADLAAAKGTLTRRIAGLRSLIVGSTRKIAEIGLAALAAGLGPVGQQVIARLQQDGDLILQVLRNPVKFAGHLLSALKDGFGNFARNASRHLQNGLGQWLSGASGITFPAKLDLSGVLMTALSVMGLTYQALRGRLVRSLGRNGEAQVQAAEGTLDTFKSLRGGLHRADEIKANQGSMGGEIVRRLKSEVTKSVVMAGITKVATMLIPGGGFATALIGAFHSVQFLIEQGRQIMGVVTSAVQSVGAIAAGNISAAVSGVEASLARSIPVALGFLGKVLGLGNIGTKVKAVIQKVRGKLDAVLDKVVVRLKGLIGRKPASVRTADESKGDQRSLAQKQESVTMASQAAASALKTYSTDKPALLSRLEGIKKNFKLKTIRLDELDEFRSSVYVEINPSATTKAEHTMFYPIDPEFELDAKGIRMTFRTRAGKKFETTIGRSGHIRNAAGFDLDLTTLGRGVTQNPANKVVNAGQNSAHIIANWFGGSGYKKSLNLLATSDHYNKRVMGGIEHRIAAWVGQYQISRFNLYIRVDWGVVEEHRLFASIESAVASLTGITDPGRLTQMRHRIARRLAGELTPVLKAVEDVEYTGHGKDSGGKPHRMPGQNAGFDRWLRI
ncbi:DUF4157 domain-containing protein [Deinococcus peraridilitoris]|nr:DUF4157 domain-containing protein [Deinococcus peraridilitoris]